MILDSEEQRQILLDLINSAAVQGTAIEPVYWVKMAVVNAQVCSSDEVIELQPEEEQVKDEEEPGETEEQL